MYAIIVDGIIEEFRDEPYYVKRYHSEQDAPDVVRWVRAKDFEEAEAISVRGTIYNLPFKEKLLPDMPEAVVAEKETAEYIFNIKQKSDDTAEDFELTKTLTEDALCEMDDSTDARIAALEDAICEFDELLNGGEE